MRIINAITLVLISTFAAFAGNGTTGYELFRTDGFARSAALAGSGVATWGDVSSLQSNPAGLAAISRRSAAASFTKHVLDINQGTLAYATPFNNKLVWAAAIDYLSYGSFDRADENGFRNGEFGASDIMLRGAVAQSLKPDLRVGAVLKYQYRDIDGIAATAIAADLGLQYETNFNDWAVGATIKSIGAATSAFLSEKDDLPTSYELGFSVPLEHLPVRFSATGAYVNKEGLEGRGGLDISFTPQFGARLGYTTVGIDQRTGLSSDAFAGFSAGLGLKIKRLAVDYALTSHGEIGFLNRFTVGTSF
ncbi:MAG: PorV/PorQ family protein [Calditrichaeota bacterium]|nr:PorV/PorQ family protein [Calditrichota bacterium]MCB9366302.1 PorV/PorQ family protein [Calditrichota bacterium]